MSKINLLGKRFGNLEVIGVAENDKNHQAQWLTRCICGNETIKRGAAIKSNKQGCGRCKSYLKEMLELDIIIDEEEEWRDVVGFEGQYEISNIGNLRGIGKGKKKGNHKSSLTKEGYYRYNLMSKEGKCTSMYVHRLVAMAFIPNPDGHKEVDHKNERKFDQRVENLRWVDHITNCNNGTRVARIQEARKGYKHSEATKQKLRERRFRLKDYIREGRTPEMIEDIKNGIGFSKFTKKYNKSGSFYYKTVSFYKINIQKDNKMEVI